MTGFVGKRLLRHFVFAAQRENPFGNSMLQRSLAWHIAKLGGLTLKICQTCLALAGYAYTDNLLHKWVATRRLFS